MAFRPKLRKWPVFFIFACTVSAATRAADVVEIARAFPDGGGYEWTGTGVPEEIRFQGQTILAKGEYTYCSGFTFAVVMKAANERELLQDRSIDELRTFQKQWYGATKESAETQCTYAANVLGIGVPVAPDNAAPGDFLQLWRTNKSGHSVVFLDWVVENGERVGVKYRSSQASTKGIGDRVEYFQGVAGKKGRVDPKRMYFCRLNEK